MTDSTTTSSGATAPLSQLLGFEPDDHVSIATHKVQRARTVSAEDLDFEYEAGLLDQQDTWIGAQPVKPGTPDKRAKASDVECVRVLYADFDSEKDGVPSDLIQGAIDELSEILGAQPVSIVASGGGVHPRWKLEKPVAPEDSKGVLNRWKITVLRVAEANGFSADSVFDLPRVLRLPGTVNEKYDPPREVTIAPGSSDLVTTAALWTNLDHANARPAPQRLEGPLPELDDAPIERPQHRQTLSERHVNAEVQKDLERLEKLSADGWDGEPWHNTTRDVAYRLAKIATSPETHYSTQEMWPLFSEAAPRDDEGFDDELIWKYWESGLEKAEGEVYELIGSGDDLFAEEMDGLLAGARLSNMPDLDIEWGSVTPSVEPGVDPVEGIAPVDERHRELPLPLIPGFSKSALRVESVDGLEDRMLRRIRTTGEDVADLHYEHEEYMHPHCLLCFPDTWREQLHRWFIRGGRDPLAIRPPAGGFAPGEGYFSFAELLGQDGPRMMIEGYVPDRSVGIMRGQGTAGKTFVAVDMSMSILCDQESWQSPLSVDGSEPGSVRVSGGVLFLAGESYLGVRDRFEALAIHHGINPRDIGERLIIRPRVPDFFNGGADLEHLIEFVRERDDIRLVVVDTLQKAAAGADQNSASDMARVNMNFARVRDAMSGGSVMVIAHTGKDNATTRGSTAIEDDSDFVLHVDVVEKNVKHVMSVKKMRDGSAGPDFEFAIVSQSGSAVIVPSYEVAPAGRKNLDSVKAVMSAMLSIHKAVDFDSPMTAKDISDHMWDSIPPRTLTGILGDLRDEGKVVNMAPGKRTGQYRLTNPGRIWIEAQGLGPL